MTREWMQLRLVLGLGVFTLGRSPAQSAIPKPTGGRPSAGVEHAVAVLRPTEGHRVKGTVYFDRQERGIHVVARLEGLTSGKHGFHVHEFGDCSRPDGSGAGGHFHPFDNPHGARDAEKRHVGDLGNVTTDESGKVEAEFIDTRLALEGEASIIGRGVIVHAGEDDLTSQPSGNAGARVACGVIGVAE